MRYREILESFQLDQDNADVIYNRFKQSYDEHLGASFSKQDFLRRAKGWTFYSPDELGGISVRNQLSGMIKLTGAYGPPRSVMRGLQELLSEEGSRPIWGMTTSNLADMAARTKMFIVPHKILGGRLILKTLLRYIPNEVLGGNKITVTDTGGVTIHYGGEVGSVTKYLIANRPYFMFLLQNNQIKEKLKDIPGVGAIFKLMGIDFK